MSLANRLPGKTIAELSALASPLNGEESFEITTATRQDGGGSVVEKTFRVTVKTILDLYAARTNNPNQVTAAQVGAYTKAEADTLLAAKLGKTEQAADSLRLGGQTASQIIDSARSGLLTLVQYESDLDQLAAAINDGTNIINNP